MSDFDFQVHFFIISPLLTLHNNVISTLKRKGGVGNPSKMARHHSTVSPIRLISGCSEVSTFLRFLSEIEIQSVTSYKFRKKVIDYNLCCRSKTTAEQQQQQRATTNRESRKARILFYFFRGSPFSRNGWKEMKLGLLKNCQNCKARRKLLRSGKKIPG